MGNANLIATVNRGTTSYVDNEFNLTRATQMICCTTMLNLIIQQKAHILIMIGLQYMAILMPKTSATTMESETP